MTFEEDKKAYSAEDWFELGKYHSSMKNSRNAIECYQECLKLDKHHYQALINMAAEYFQLKNYMKSINACFKAIKINPDDANAWLNLAASYFQLNENGRALYCFKKASDIGSIKADRFLKKAERLHDPLLMSDIIDVYAEIFNKTKKSDKKKSKSKKESKERKITSFRLKSLRCSECGGLIEIEDAESEFVQCKYCREVFKKELLSYKQ